MQDMDLPDNLRSAIIDILSYFTFTGAGSGDQKHPADGILNIQGWNFNNGQDISTALYITEEEKKKYIESQYNKLKISLRSGKGMPGGIKYKEDEKYEKFKDKFATCAEWCYEYPHNGKTKMCGALHMRYIK